MKISNFIQEEIDRIIEKANFTDREKELLAAAEYYYEEAMSGIIGLDEAIVTLEDIKNAKKEKEEAYKIDTLEKCDAKKTKAILTLKDGKIESSKVELNCE